MADSDVRREDIKTLHAGGEMVVEGVKERLVTEADDMGGFHGNRHDPRI